MGHLQKDQTQGSGTELVRCNFKKALIEVAWHQTCVCTCKKNATTRLQIENDYPRKES
jgi:hypothetical protein